MTKLQVRLYILGVVGIAVFFVFLLQYEHAKRLSMLRYPFVDPYAATPSAAIPEKKPVMGKLLPEPPAVRIPFEPMPRRYWLINYTIFLPNSMEATVSGWMDWAA